MFLSEQSFICAQNFHESGVERVLNVRTFQDRTALKRLVIDLFVSQSLGIRH